MSVGGWIAVQRVFSLNSIIQENMLLFIKSKIDFNQDSLLNFNSLCHKMIINFFGDLCVVVVGVKSDVFCASLVVSNDVSTRRRNDVITNRRSKFELRVINVSKNFKTDKKLFLEVSEELDQKRFCVGAVIVAQWTARSLPIPADPGFKSSHRQLLLNNLMSTVCTKDEKKRKRFCVHKNKWMSISLKWERLLDE